MKLIACCLVCLLTVAAVPLKGQSSPADALTATVQRNHELHARALQAVQAERERAKQPLCPKAMNTIEINTCYAAELEITDGNYVKLARALGALLRPGDEAKDGASTRIPFDDAETTWHTYRDQACVAAGDQYAGGTIRPMIEIGCRITITRHHMDELWAVYSDVGTH
jgi:uncharacterized protein YecT (DUF1311 family)